MKPIDYGPPVVRLDERLRIGDWEGSLAGGRMSRSAIGTLVDRRSRLLRLVHLPDGHSADQLRLALLPVLAAISAPARQTLTWDQGSEMAHHDQIAHYFADGTYFAHPASPWLRGTNKNSNGLLRQYFPKGADLSRFTVEQLQAVEDKLNNRPRKTLSRQTPAEVFAQSLRGLSLSVATVT